MPVTIKRSKVKYKDPNTGNYVGVDAVSERSSEELILDITTEGQAQLNAINTRAAEIQASYPEISEVKDMIAVPFVQATAYPAGKQVIQAVNGVDKLYILPNGHTAGDSWDNTDKLGPFNLSDEITDLKSTVDGLGLFVANGKLCIVYEEVSA